LKNSLAFGNKVCVVAFVDEDVTDEAAGSAQGSPTAIAGRATVIEALPGELGAGCTVARAVAHVEASRSASMAMNISSPLSLPVYVEIGLDGGEHQLAAVLCRFT
jgi:hypothetical protein